MARRSGPEPIFKKRYVAFSILLVNSTPTICANIAISETATIYSCKVSMAGLMIGGAGVNVQEIRSWVRCTIDDAKILDPGDVADPNDPYTTSEMDNLNGFTLPNIWTTPSTFDPLDTPPLYAPEYVNEKYRFRRKCDCNTVVRIEADTITRQGAARSVQFFGYMELVIRVR